MTHRPTTIERAYELATTFDCRTVAEIKAKLKTEGYSDINGQLYGPSISKSLRQHCDASRPKDEAAPAAEADEDD